jgi:hypothetical protein
VPADPTATTGQLYNASTPPTWTASRVVKVAAFDAAGTRSAIVQRNYTITVAAVAAPTVNPASGTFTGSVTATMTADPGTTIRFTVGIGTNVPADPTATTGQVYNPAAPPTWTASRVVKIRAFNSSGVASTVVRRNYTITP